jgi:hypothetical protein
VCCDEEGAYVDVREYSWKLNSNRNFGRGNREPTDIGIELGKSSLRVRFSLTANFLQRTSIRISKGSPFGSNMSNSDRQRHGAGARTRSSNHLFAFTWMR